MGLTQFQTLIYSWHVFNKHLCCFMYWGGGPRVVVCTAAFHARVRGSFSPSTHKNSVLWGASGVACSDLDRQG